MGIAGMSTRLLLRTFRRPPASPSSAGLLHRSPKSPPTPHTKDIRHLHVLPRALLPNIRWFGGGSKYWSSSSLCKAAPPRRRGILGNMFSASTFVFTSAAAALLDREDRKSPPTRPHPVSAPSGDAAALLLLDWDNGLEGRPPTRPHVEREKRPVTDALIALNLIVHGVNIVTGRKLTVWGAKNNDLIRKGQIWRLATPSLLHSGIIHITLNMLALDDFGSAMEEVTGPRRLLATYCVSALAGSLMSYRFTAGNAIGSSGAIFGLIGAQAVYTSRRRESLTSARDTLKEIRDMIIFSLAFGLALRLIKIRIDNWAHFGGFLGGAAVELFLGPRGKQQVARVATMALEDISSNEHEKIKN